LGGTNKLNSYPQELDENESLVVKMAHLYRGKIQLSASPDK